MAGLDDLQRERDRWATQVDPADLDAF
jgi:hypothetical protein